MKCNRCGVEVPSDAAFCSLCGSKIEAAGGYGYATPVGDNTAGSPASVQTASPPYASGPYQTYYPSYRARPPVIYAGNSAISLTLGICAMAAIFLGLCTLIVLPLSLGVFPAIGFGLGLPALMLGLSHRKKAYKNATAGFVLGVVAVAVEGFSLLFGFGMLLVGVWPNV